MIRQKKENYKTKRPEGSKISVATTFEEIEAIRSIWEQMLSNDSYPVTDPNINRFMTVIEASENHAQPYVMLLHHQDKPKAIVAGRIESHPLKFEIGYWTICRVPLRCLSVVYGGILGQPTYDVCIEIVHQFQKILKQRIVDVVLLYNIRTDSDIYKAVRKIPGFLCRSHNQKFQQHWQTSISSTSEEFGGLLSKKRKRDIHRCIRNLEKACSGPVKIICYNQKEDVQEFLKIASHISDSTYQGGMGKGVVKDSLTLSLLNQAQDDGWLRAYVLYAGSEPVAFEYGCVYGNLYFAEQAGFDPRRKTYGPGTILQLKIFEQLSQIDGVTRYDFGFGDATYKQRFGSDFWSEVSVGIFAPYLYPVLINILDSSIRGISIFLGHIVHKLGLTERIKKWWRMRLRPVQTKISKECPAKGSNIHEQLIE